MTINELQSALIREIEALSRDMGLVNKRGEPADLKGYPQAIRYSPCIRMSLLRWMKQRTVIFRRNRICFPILSSGWTEWSTRKNGRMSPILTRPMY